MSFQDRAESWRAKAHLSGVRLPVLVGLTALALVAALCAGGALLNAAGSGGFSIERGEGVLSGEGEKAAPEGDGAGEDQPASVVVHVGGAVAAPGVQRLFDGARVQDAIDAAGGFAEGAAPDALNLARVLVDGEQVVVPTLEQLAAPSEGAAGAGGPAARPSGKIDVNRAGAAELDALPGVGPATAEKIVADREQNGPFRSVEDLKRVSGIGDKKLAELADLVCVA